MVSARALIVVVRRVILLSVMIPAAGTASLLCVIEGYEAMALLSGRRPAWRAAFGAVLCALGAAAVLVVAAALLPGRAVRVTAATAVLLIGFQWLVRAVLRLLKPGPPGESTVFAIVLAAAAESVLACAALAAACHASVALWTFGGLGCAVLAAGAGLAVRRALAVPQLRVPKAVLALALTATGAAAAVPFGWWAAAAAPTVVTLAVLRLRSAPPPGRARDTSGLRGFLLGDTAVTWPAALAFAALAAVLDAAWRPVLLAFLVAVVLVTATGRRGTPH